MTGKKLLDLKKRADEVFEKIEELNRFPFAVDFLAISEKEIAEKESKLSELEAQRNLLTSVVALSVTTDEAKSALINNIEQVELNARGIKDEIAFKKCKIDEYKKLKEFLKTEAESISKEFSNFGDFIFEEEEPEDTQIWESSIDLKEDEKAAVEEIADEEAKDEQIPESIPDFEEEAAVKKEEDVEDELPSAESEKSQVESEATQDNAESEDMSFVKNAGGNILDLFTATLRVFEEHIREVQGKSENLKSYPSEYEAEYAEICSQLSPEEAYDKDIIPGFNSWESKVILHSLPVAFLKAIGRSDVIRVRAAADNFYYKGQRNKWRTLLTLTTVEELKNLPEDERKEYILSNIDTRVGTMRKLKMRAFCYTPPVEEVEADS